MADRLPSDHPSIETHRVSIERRGRMDRPRLDCSGIDASLPIEEAVRLTLNGDTYHARIERTFEGDPEIRGAYDNPRLAREPAEGTDRLAEWQTRNDLEFGRSVLLDVVASEHAYGLRVPGERAVYEATAPLDDSLRSIARSLDDDR
ncbi:hypothetical protein BRC86_07000 [Halobacteriales archaeon QS_3_64_16]|nr:MAG: hypothetical protein BRC86_07000 [Halobacteriales archaeon QS_3_64_16]